MQALSIYDPQYRYPPSRNPYRERLEAEFAGRVYADNESESRPGKWRETCALPESSELHVEIGCNGGQVILELAKRAPQAGWIGLDWKHKQIHRGAERAAKRGLTNLLFLRAHAERLSYMFAPNEISHLALFFPDPWTKPSQHKNRYFTEDRLRELAKLVRPDGDFEIRTDHPGYFAWMEKAVAKATDLWQVEERTADRHAGNPDAKKLQSPDVTVFENMFIRQDLPIHLLRLRRR